MTSIFETAVARVSPSVQPLVLETGVAEAPYAQTATVFIVGKGQRVFAVTARHTLSLHSLSPLCVFPGFGERHFLPLKDVHYVAPDALLEDWTDFALVEIDMGAIRSERHGMATVVNLNSDMPSWKDDCHTAPFVALGYPQCRSFIDYDDCIIHSELESLYGSYLGPAASNHLHEIKVENSRSLPSFSGFSGGPVFNLVRRLGKLPTLALAGVVVQGGAASNIVRFIEYSVLHDALQAW